MTSEVPLSVLFLWHQHQPLYKDPLANRYELPWVRLHATKDYYDMVALLEEFPRVRANFNLVPSLLAQLDDYAQGKAQDPFLTLTLKSAADLSFEDRQFILRHFFMAHWENMIDPYPRYRELLDKRGRTTTPEGLSRAQNYFKEQDWRDMQVWFNLAWFDPWWRERDPFIRSLFEKGKGFTEEDKGKLVAKQIEICAGVAAKHKELQDRGQIEVTTTPFYHPILPLLCDSETARVALPQTLLPQQRFQHPEDAAEQIRRAVEDYRGRFGRPPKGMWPSEGSVSEAVAKLFVEAGIRWVATDEAILARSLPSASFIREDLYEPYQFKLGDKTLHFFFRDHELSDAIGFSYSSWKPEAAAQDFMQRLRDIRTRLKEKEGGKSRPHVVSVILDGENCWEYYKQDGLPFLRELYKRLSEDPAFETVRASDYLDRVSENKILSRLWAGSWINANFAIWIGRPEDNRAWDLLSRTRQFLQSHLQAHPESAQSHPALQAWEEIYIAEGSDWCWWYGDDHSSANDETFDYLFRKHLMNVYTLLGVKVPEDLHFPIKVKGEKAALKPPVDFITPRIDGRVTSYFEWQGAGVYETEAGSTGTMHRAQNLIKSIYYGFDLQNLYFRLDLNRPITPDLLVGITLKVAFLKPEGYEVSGRFVQEKGMDLQISQKQQDGSETTQTLPAGAVQKIIEFAVSLTRLPDIRNQDIEALIVVQKDNLEQERWPAKATIRFPYPTQDAFNESWVI